VWLLLIAISQFEHQADINVISQFEHQADIKGNQQQKFLEASLWLKEIKLLKRSMYDRHSPFKNGQE
jgi:hypothetical protein